MKCSKWSGPVKERVSINLSSLALIVWLSVVNIWLQFLTSKPMLQLVPYYTNGMKLLFSSAEVLVITCCHVHMQKALV